MQKCNIFWLFKRLPLVFFCFPLLLEGQIFYDFESNDTLDWNQHPVSTWEITGAGALNGLYSLHHAYDNASAGSDKASFLLNGLDLERDTVEWQFQVMHGYNPSGANNWAFFLTSDKDASGMDPGSDPCGYAVGVNFIGYDDLLQLWKIDKGETTLVCQTQFDWQQEVGTDSAAGIRVVRYPAGTWEILVDKNGGFNDLRPIGEGYDDEIFPGLFGGIYYQYTSSQDRKIWLDDISVMGTFIPDTLPPNVTSAHVSGSNLLELTFSEQLDKSFLAKDHFHLLPGIVPDSISSTSGDEVILYFIDDFEDDIENQLVINNIKDFHGNTIYHDTLEFVYHIPKPGDLVFTEIMADPYPVNGLPDHEYIEIKNISGYTINMENWEMIVSTAGKYLPEFYFNPGEHLILCHANGVNDFETHGDVLGIFTSIYTLPNSGTALSLLSPGGTLIDSIKYKVVWHPDKEKRSGGYSLEKIDFSRFCSPADNWTTSIHPDGGTPGILNSVSTFNPDTLAPRIMKVDMEGDTGLIISFNEPLDETRLSNQNFELGELENQLDSFLYLPGEFLVKLFYHEPFPERVSISIRISALADFCGNTMPDTLLNFTLNTGEPGDIVINEIMADPNPVAGLPGYEYLELYNTSDFPVNMKDWLIMAGRNSGYFPEYTLLPGHYLIICNEDAFPEFEDHGEVLGLFSGTFLRNSGDTVRLLNKNSKVIDVTPYFPAYHVNVEKRQGGYSLEMISPDDTCGTSSNWVSSVASPGGTPGKINSVYRQGPDTIAPGLVEFNVLGDTVLKISFSEELQQPVSWNQLFKLNNAGPDTVITIDGNHTSFVLHFDFSFPDTNTIHIKNIMDVCGNIAPDSSIIFYNREGEAYDVLITEIMADPSPVVGLPEFEYIEIYNASENKMDVGGWKIFINNNSMVLPGHEIDPNEHLILTDKDNQTLLDSSWSVLLLDNLTALPNAGAEIILKNKKEKFIHGMRYSPDLHEKTKQSGGWSLELAFPNSPCMVDDNWISSSSPLGGTPSAMNAVQPTVNPYPPMIKSIGIKDDSLLAIHFTHSMPELLSNGSRFVKVIPSMEYPGEIYFLDSLYTRVAIGFREPFRKGIDYRLQITRDIKSCDGHLLEFGRDDAFTLPYHPAESELVINEILFNPSPGGYDFIEMYNRSDKTFNAADIYLSKRDENYQLEDITKVTQQSMFVRPGNYLVVTGDIEWLRDHYTCDEKGMFIENKSMPSFPDKEGRVVLTDSLYKVVDEMIYEESMHFGMLITAEGVSLERIDPGHASLERENWHSAAQTAGFATPGYQNSQYSDEVISDKTVHLEPEIFSPDNDGVDDRLNIHYQLDKPGYVATIMVLDARGRRVSLLADRLALDRKGKLTWDGITDEQYIVPPGIYVVYIELFHPDGDVKKFKKTCVRGGRY